MKRERSTFGILSWTGKPEFRRRLALTLRRPAVVTDLTSDAPAMSLNPSEWRLGVPLTASSVLQASTGAIMLGRFAGIGDREERGTELSPQLRGLPSQPPMARLTSTPV